MLLTISIFSLISLPRNRRLPRFYSCLFAELENVKKRRKKIYTHGCLIMLIRVILVFDAKRS